MNSPVTCNSCHKDFFIEENSYGVVETDNLTIKYFSCPHCGRRYPVITLNEQMKGLIAQRLQIQGKIKLARQQHFRQKTIDGLVRELEKVRVEQTALFAQLKRQGEVALKKLDGDGDGTV